MNFTLGPKLPAVRTDIVAIPPLMRLLSFFNQVETTLAMLKPECAGGWKRRANYLTGAAVCWHERAGFTLNLQASALGNNRFSLQTHWSGPAGATSHERTFFCGASPFDWQAAADAVAEAMPEPPPSQEKIPEHMRAASA